MREEGVKIGVVAYGVGNIRSVLKTVKIAGGCPVVARRQNDLQGVDGVILPGVGAFKAAMNYLKNRFHLLPSLLEEVPALGICLGMQLLFEESEEGGLTSGLKLMKGRVKRLPPSVKVPHMGWNEVEVVRRIPLLEGLPNRFYAYFAHSYVAVCGRENTVAYTSYGVKFPSVVAYGNLYGTQFHPEKSGLLGLRIIRNFVSIVAGRAARV